MAANHLRHMAAWYPHVDRLRKRRERRLRPIRPSHRAELAYRANLQGVVRDLRAAGADIAARLKPTWQPRGVGDAVLAADETDPRLSALMQQAAANLGRIDLQAKQMALLAVRRSREQVDERLIAAIRSSVGFDITEQLVDSSDLGVAMSEALGANVALIKSMPEEYLAQVREVVTKAWQGGVRWEELAKQIAARGGVAENRAWTIARDQTSKMNAAFNKARQTGLGIEEYDWSGTLDVRERPSHRRMEGVRCRWDSPPTVDGERVHAGEAILCRCVARPVFNLNQVSGGGLEQVAA